jgi:glyoxylase-like metal-dependent hydrolase (beta-lactamase superfamily II)
LCYAAAPIPIHKKSYDRVRIFKTEYEVLDGDIQLLDGICLKLTPGHSPGSQSVIINTAKGKYALVGDLIDFMECWDREPKIPNGYHTDLIAYEKSFKKIEKEASVILTSHEPKILEQPVYPNQL